MIRARRFCAECGEITEQTAASCRYDTPPAAAVPPVLVKRIEWLCGACGGYNEEIKQTIAPTDKASLMKRLLSISDDYDVLGFTLSSEPNVISIKIRLPDFDMSELRAIQSKQRETGFITVGELMKVQRAGYKQPIAVPPKPQPRDVATLRKRERQRVFSGDPRPY